MSEDRQAIRDRAADAYITHEEVVLGPGAWVPPMRAGHRMSARVRKEAEREFRHLESGDLGDRTTGAT